MNSERDPEWHWANQHYLVTALDRIRDLLNRKILQSDEDPAKVSSSQDQICDSRAGNPEYSSGQYPGQYALDVLCDRFGLSPFERDILLLCAGIELDSSFAALCASSQGDPSRPYPTFSLALAAFPGAHWSALSPAAPLRYWRMIEVGSGPSLTSAAVRIDERILHYLTGIQFLDERLKGYASPCLIDLAGEDLVPSHRAVVGRIAGIWSGILPAQRWPVIQLYGPDAPGKRDIVTATCAYMGLSLLCLPAHFLPVNPTELEALVRLCDRESVLSLGAICLQCDDLDISDISRAKAISWMVETIKTPLLISAREPLPTGPGTGLCISVSGPDAGEQQDLWRAAVDGSTMISDHTVEMLVSQFKMSSRTIRHIGNLCRSIQNQGDQPVAAQGGTPSTVLWDTCREQARTRLSDLAQTIRPGATWQDLVLPDLQKDVLREIATQVRQRMKVYETWGFGSKSSRGLGISALFSGASGTGKTMAAEVLANELSLDLYRIDLSQVVSKYIGETEKNLRRVFEAAEEGGAILLFDEADALFGKRSEVKDSHDRYANIEVSYLLQRMEEYRGLAILTTNMKEALDPAFLRRIRFVVQFPFPDIRHRSLIWEQVFPEATPVQGLDYTKLARLNISGGNIRNIALSAAFLAADDGGVVQMKHLLRASRAEYAKMDRALTDAEVGGWV
jgi:ATP-dependent 26S proteasome regulatory subunit